MEKGGYTFMFPFPCIMSGNFLGTSNKDGSIGLCTLIIFN